MSSRVESSFAIFAKNKISLKLQEYFPRKIVSRNYAKKIKNVKIIFKFWADFLKNDGCSFSRDMTKRIGGCSQ